jgi:response regulator RpfG family c-di-GMP phosphodiesterase
MKKENKLTQNKVNSNVSKPISTSQIKKEVLVTTNKLTKNKEEPVKVSDNNNKEKKADLSLYLEFMECYNKNDIEKTKEILNKSKTLKF